MLFAPYTYGNGAWIQNCDIVFSATIYCRQLHLLFTANFLINLQVTGHNEEYNG